MFHDIHMHTTNSQQIDKLKIIFTVFLIQYNKENTRNYRWITCRKNVTRDTTQYQ